MLYGVGPENAENLFGAQSFFAGAHARHREHMIDSDARCFGGSRPPMTVNAMNV